MYFPFDLHNIEYKKNDDGTYQINGQCYIMDENKNILDGIVTICRAKINNDTIQVFKSTSDNILYSIEIKDKIK